MHIDFDRSKSLQELEGEDWGEPRPKIAWSNLVQRVYKMRRLPVESLTVRDIETLLGQGLSLKYVMPVAMDLLQEDPWEDDGFLLHAVLGDSSGCKVEFWQQHPQLWAAMREILQRAITLLPTLDELTYSFVNERSTTGPEEKPSVVEQIRLALDEE